MKILITAGPTREPIDPIRYISNLSTGLMGYTIAKEAKRKGHQVILISGPSPYSPPRRIKVILVETARQMKNEVEKFFSKVDCLIMASAVCDWRPCRMVRHKIKLSRKRWFLELVRNPDILKGLGKRKGKRLLIGFALETENLLKNARAKLVEKNMDLVVANIIGKRNCPFGEGPTSVSIIDRGGKVTGIKNKKKEEVAIILLDKIEEMWHNLNERDLCEKEVIKI